MEKPEIQTPEDGTENVQEDTQNLNGGETPETSQESAKQSQQPDTQQQQQQEEPDYKTKFAESTRENQILNAKLQGYESRRELTNEPTEAELRAAFPSFDFMTETEKDLAKGQLRTQKKADAAYAAEQKREADAKWNNQLEIAITSNPSLQGRESEFKEYASKPSHRGAPTDVLVDAFLHRSTTQPKPKSDPKPELESGSGGPKEPAKKKISLEEAAVIRKTDYKRYLELVKTGQIEEDI